MSSACIFTSSSAAGLSVEVVARASIWSFDISSEAATRPFPTREAAVARTVCVDPSLLATSTEDEGVSAGGVSEAARLLIQVKVRSSSPGKDI